MTLEDLQLFPNSKLWFCRVNNSQSHPQLSDFLMYENSVPSVIFHPLDIHNLGGKLITNNSKGDRPENFFC
ncbi:MAG: hypothetical protein MGF17_13790 [Trichodesmium sp. MAG_R04]|nr:hypothetical protein [Trichodesmium sp. MAG_R04]